MNHSKIMKIILLILTLIFLLCVAASASDDFQYWSRVTLKTWERERVSLSTLGEVRFMENAGDLRLDLISEQLKYRWHQNLDLGLNLTHLNSQTSLPSGKEDFQYQYRLELEANPHWDTAGGLKIKNRNRVEFRKIEDQGSDNTRFRHLWEFDLSFQDAFPIQSLYLNDEFFYDFDKHECNENRATPAGVKIRISDKIVLQVFWMIQSKKETSSWASNQILGTHFLLSF